MVGVSSSPYHLEHLVSITLCSFSAILHVSSSPWHLQERPGRKCGPIYQATFFFEGVHSNKKNKHISPSPYCLEYLVSITLCSFSAILHVSSSPLHSQERPGRNWFLFSPDLFSLLGRQK